MASNVADKWANKKSFLAPMGLKMKFVKVLSKVQGHSGPFLFSDVFSMTNEKEDTV